MKRLKRLVYNSLLILTAICSLSISVFAVTEAEVEAQVAAIGKEGVAGNVLIWFLYSVTGAIQLAGSEQAPTDICKDRITGTRKGNGYSYGI